MTDSHEPAGRASYFLSDLHIRAADDARTRRILDFLAARRGEASAIFLVGDVFDFWLPWRTVVPRAYFPVLRALADLADEGTRVVVFAGNHDPDPGDFFGEIGVEVVRRSLEVTLGGRRVWVEHGDVIDPRSRVSRLVCRLAHHRKALALARAVHPDLAWRLALAYARRAREQYGELMPRDCVDVWLPDRARAGADVVVVGHFHRAFHHEGHVDGRSVALFGLGDWVEQRTFLRYRDGAFELLRDHGPHAPATVLGLGDHGPPPR